MLSKECRWYCSVVEEGIFYIQKCAIMNVTRFLYPFRLSLCAESVLVGFGRHLVADFFWCFSSAPKKKFFFQNLPIFSVGSFGGVRESSIYSHYQYMDYLNVSNLFSMTPVFCRTSVRFFDSNNGFMGGGTNSIIS